MWVPWLFDNSMSFHVAIKKNVTDFTQIWFNSDLDLKDELIGICWSEVFWFLATSPNYISSSQKKRKKSGMINDKVRLSKANFILISSYSAEINLFFPLWTLISGCDFDISHTLMWGLVPDVRQLTAPLFWWPFCAWLLVHIWFWTLKIIHLLRPWVRWQKKKYCKY